MPITNEERAAWAAHALQAYATAKQGGHELYDEAELVLSDFLTDLMHYAAREGIEFCACLTRAEMHYGVECAGELSAPFIADLMAAAAETAAVLRTRKAIAYDRCARQLEALINTAKGGGS